VDTETKVTIISTPQGFNEDELYVDLEPLFGRSVFLKCEGFNFAGSIKLKAATEMVEAAERDGVLTPGSILVESALDTLTVVDKGASNTSPAAVKVVFGKPEQHFLIRRLLLQGRFGGL
jgi:hypothetical protein